MKRFIPLILFIAVIVGATKAYNYFTAENPNQAQVETSNKQFESTPTLDNSVKSSEALKEEDTKPKMIIDANKSYQAVIKTSVGDITVDLTAKATPITVNNFVTLSRKDFYNNTIFHRVIKGFMIQGGDPKGDGTGGPGYKFDDESFEGEYERGTVAMANSGPNTNGSQFFIMHEDYKLPKNYVIFGHVSSGIETVDKIATAAVKPNPYTGEESVPVIPVTVKTIEIWEK